MAVGVRIRFDDKDLRYVLNKLPENLNTEVKDGAHRTALYTVKTLKRNLLNDSLVSSRRKLASQRIRAKKRVKGSVVTMPGSLVKLDTMRPHYVPVKWGSGIRRWVNSVGKLKRRTGKSVIYTTPTGKIKYAEGAKSAIYVTPHKFIDKSLLTVRNRFRNELRKSVKKAFKNSKR